MREIGGFLSCMLCSLALVTVTASTALAGCADEEFAAEAFDRPIPTGPYDCWALVEVDGEKRPLWLTIPEGYDHRREVPLLIFLHNGNGSALAFRLKRRHLLDLIRPDGFIVAFAQGYRPDDPVGKATWNAIHCCGPSFKDDVDDVGYVAAIVETLKTHLAIDPDRIYVVGASNGGMLAHRVAAERLDLFAAVAVVSGTVGGQATKRGRIVEIRPTAPIPVLMIHGIQDRSVHYGGGINKDEWRRDLSFGNSIARWVLSNDCDPEPTRPASEDDEAHIQTYAGCAADSEVVGVSIENQGHGWPPQADQMIVCFFNRHVKTSR